MNLLNNFGNNILEMGLARILYHVDRISFFSYAYVLGVLFSFSDTVSPMSRSLLKLMKIGIRTELYERLAESMYHNVL